MAIDIWPLSVREELTEHGDYILQQRQLWCKQHMQQQSHYSAKQSVGKMRDKSGNGTSPIKDWDSQFSFHCAQVNRTVFSLTGEETKPNLATKRPFTALQSSVQSQLLGVISEL